MTRRSWTDLITDVQLHLPDPLLRLHACNDVTLSYLSLVECAAVPFHHISGPAFEVFTDDESTEAWFGKTLLRDPFEDGADGDEVEHRLWSTKPYWQSDIGILLRVEGDLRVTQNGATITELLLYASRVREPRTSSGGILTPPRSSSPNHGLEVEAQQTSIESQPSTVSIYALPLSSELWSKLNQYPDLAAEEFEEGFAQFLPSPTYSMVEDEGPRKRQRLDSLFEDATKQVKRAKRRGGESVAKNMALYSQASSRPIRDNSTQANGDNTLEPNAPEAHTSKLPRKLGLSRSQSLGSLSDLDNVRPSSRASVKAPTQRSSLNHVTSISALDSSSPVPDATNSIEEQNKVALSRVVMAGMRMYGLQQKKKTGRSRAVSEIPLTAEYPQMAAEMHNDEDEYKFVYHQTYKAASFTFRKHIAVVGIGQDMMRETVDQLLGMFCVDPVERFKPSEMLQHGFGSQEGPDTNYFDLPSTKANNIEDCGPIERRAASMSPG